jgi:hypothetical protein
MQEMITVLNDVSRNDGTQLITPFTSRRHPHFSLDLLTFQLISNHNVKDD